MSVRPVKLWRAQGLCTNCGDARDVPGRNWCAACSQKRRDRVAVRSIAARAAGVCTNCFVRPVGTGGKWCESCLENHKANPARVAWEFRAGRYPNAIVRAALELLDANKALKTDNAKQQLAARERVGRAWAWLTRATATYERSRAAYLQALKDAEPQPRMDPAAVRSEASAAEVAC